ncbi:MAG TPA: protease complex subunit PrcB family protein [Candidatus Limnocylindria bacterium]|nr:protease complex subunit PrcB family protein [Candidatus Limnocylindria bacterium]
MRSACSAIVAAALLLSCAGGGSVSASPRAVAFSEVASTAMSDHDAGPAIVVGTSAAARAAITREIPVKVQDGQVLVAVFEGLQRTGGYAIRIIAIERSGDRLTVRATFTKPPADAIVTQVLTSPAHVVSISTNDAAGLREAVLLDETGTERARLNST